MSSPVVDAVLGCKVDETELFDLAGVNVAAVRGEGCRANVGSARWWRDSFVSNSSETLAEPARNLLNADGGPDSGADTVRSEDEIGPDDRAILKCDRPRPLVHGLDAMVDVQTSRRTLSLFAEGGLDEDFMHILPVEHVVDVAPFLLVIGKRVGIDGLSRLPLDRERSERNSVSIPRTPRSVP